MIFIKEDYKIILENLLLNEWKNPEIRKCIEKMMEIGKDDSLSQHEKYLKIKELKERSQELIKKENEEK